MWGLCLTKHCVNFVLDFCPALVLGTFPLPKQESGPCGLWFCLVGALLLTDPSIGSAVWPFYERAVKVYMGLMLYPEIEALYTST